MTLCLNLRRKRLNSTESCHQRTSTPLLGGKTVGHHHIIHPHSAFNTESLIIPSLKNLFNTAFLHLSPPHNIFPQSTSLPDLKPILT